MITGPLFPFLVTTKHPSQFSPQYEPLHHCNPHPPISQGALQRCVNVLDACGLVITLTVPSTKVEVWEEIDAAILAHFSRIPIHLPASPTELHLTQPHILSELRWTLIKPSLKHDKYALNADQKLQALDYTIVDLRRMYKNFRNTLTHAAWIGK